MKIRIKYFYLLLALITQASFSQSIYSAFGIGSLEYSFSPRKAGMGDLGLTLQDRDFVSHLNPAALSKISSTRFEAGTIFNQNYISSSQTSNTFFNSYFSGLSFAFPVQRDYGIGFATGIVPYSKTNYVGEKKVTSSTLGNHSIISENRGGLSRLFLGSSYETDFGFAVGAYYDYYFGNFTSSSIVEWEDEAKMSAEYKSELRLKGNGFTLGIISDDMSKSLFNNDDITELKIGLSMSLISTLKGDSLLTSNSSLHNDTLTNADANSEIPMRLGFGVSLKYLQRYTFYFDGIMQQWSEFKLNGAAQNYYRNSLKLSLGFEMRPENNASTFWEQTIWRAGLSYQQNPVTVFGTNLDELIVSGGFSLPLSRENTLDFALQFVNRGTTDNNLLKENLFRIYAGVSLGELWFVRTER